MKIAKKEYQRDLNDIESAAWNLIYCMVEAGAEPRMLARRRNGKKGVSVRWWENEWDLLRKALEKRGLNCNPEVDE